MTNTESKATGNQSRIAVDPYQKLACQFQIEENTTNTRQQSNQFYPLHSGDPTLIKEMNLLESTIQKMSTFNKTMLLNNVDELSPVNKMAATNPININQSESVATDGSQSIPKQQNNYLQRKND